MQFNKINSENMRLREDSKVSSTYTRQIATDEFGNSEVLKNPRLAPFIGDVLERRVSDDTSHMLSTEEISRQLSDYAEAVQKAVNPNKKKEG